MNLCHNFKSTRSNFVKVLITVVRVVFGSWKIGGVLDFYKSTFVSLVIKHKPDDLSKSVADRLAVFHNPGPSGRSAGSPGQSSGSNFTIISSVVSFITNLNVNILVVSHVVALSLLRLLVIDTLSEVLKYLNELKNMLDDGDSAMKVEELVKVGTKLEKVDDMHTIVFKEKVLEEVKHEVVVFIKAPCREYCEPVMRFSTPCGVEEEILNTLGFIRLDYGDYGRKMIKDVRVEIHGYDFHMDFVVVDYVNEGEPSIVFGRNFLVAIKSQVDFRLGEMLIDITMLKEDKDVDILLANLVEDMVEDGKMGSGIVTMEEISPPSSSTPQPIFYPPSPKQKEKILEALDRKYKVLEDEKLILKVLVNYMVYRNKLDEVLMGRARLKNKDFIEEEKEIIVENGLPQKLSDLGKFILSVRVNGATHLSSLVDTGASVSVLPYSLYNNIGLGNPQPYHFNITMADNTQAKAMGRPFLRTCGALIDISRSTMTIDDGVIKHTYYPKPRAKAYLESLEMDEDEDWLSCFEVGRDEEGNPKYGPIAPSFQDIEDEMERALAMEAYYNPFKNIIFFKKLIDFLGSLPVQLKSSDWCSEGHGVYKKTEGDGMWHAKFEETTPSGRNFTRGFKTKATKRNLSKEHQAHRIHHQTHSLSREKNAYNERLAKLKTQKFGVTRIGKLTTEKKKSVEIRYSLLHILHKMLVRAFVHRTSSRDKVQKPDLWLLSLLDEGYNSIVAWILAEYLSWRAPGIKEESKIYGGHFVTKIAKKKTKKLSPITSLEAPPQASLNDIDRRYYAKLWRKFHCPES
ncbi:DNA-directed DNA polymerase, partial [Tanacetum coccineum]